ncbi:MAG TPA: DinB family protein [Gemmatimonadales bacterium]|jgi:uncharacterized damage-inducible protein DinB
MTPITDALLAELDNEAATTRRVLERLPEDKFDWKPHPKSYSLGELGLHTAQVPGALSNLLTPDSVEPPTFQQGSARSRAELLAALDQSMADAREFIKGLTPERAETIWKMTSQGHDIIAAPRMALVRALVFNHWYHHRGQLLVYLRLLDEPVPSVYGPTADENPFG